MSSSSTLQPFPQTVQLEFVSNNLTTQDKTTGQLDNIESVDSCKVKLGVVVAGLSDHFPSGKGNFITKFVPALEETEQYYKVLSYNLGENILDSWGISVPCFDSTTATQRAKNIITDIIKQFGGKFNSIVIDLFAHSYGTLVSVEMGAYLKAKFDIKSNKLSNTKVNLVNIRIQRTLLFGGPRFGFDRNTLVGRCIVIFWNWLPKKITDLSNESKLMQKINDLKFIPNTGQTTYIINLKDRIVPPSTTIVTQKDLKRVIMNIKDGKKFYFRSPQVVENTKIVNLNEVKQSCTDQQHQVFNNDRVVSEVKKWVNQGDLSNSLFLSCYPEPKPLVKVLEQIKNTALSKNSTSDKDIERLEKMVSKLSGSIDKHAEEVKKGSQLIANALYTLIAVVVVCFAIFMISGKSN